MSAKKKNKDEQERRTHLDAYRTIARYEQDKRRYAELQEDIMERYKGALAAQPGGHPEGGHVTGDPEKRLLELEALARTALYKRIEAVGLAFNDLRAYRLRWGDTDDEMDKLCKAIMASCDNRRLYGFYGLQRTFRLNYGETTFTTSKRRVRDKVIELLDL